MCGVNFPTVLFRTISRSMDVIKVPMMMVGRCVYYCVMSVLCVNVLFLLGWLPRGFKIPV